MGFVKKYLKFKQIIVKALRKACQGNVKNRDNFILNSSILYFGCLHFFTIGTIAIKWINKIYFIWVMAIYWSYTLIKSGCPKIFYVIKKHLSWFKKLCTPSFISYSTAIRFLLASNVLGPIPGTLMRSSGCLKWPLVLRNSMMACAFFSPIPFRFINSAADAVLMLIFCGSAAQRLGR